MPISVIRKMRFLDPASFNTFGASGGEAAPLRRVCGRGNIPMEQDSVLFGLRVGHGNCRYKGLRIGMKRVAEKSILASQLYQFAEIENGYAV